MEKDIGKIPKNDTTEIVIRIDDFGGKKGLTIREFVTSERYTGFSKSGTRIPTEHFLKFREMINSIELDDMKQEESAEKEEKSEFPKTPTTLKNKKEKFPVEKPGREEELPDY